jgi:hypothetical protein
MESQLIFTAVGAVTIFSGAADHSDLDRRNQ